MDKVIKLQSLQGSGFDAVKKLCDFDIPPGAVYDLSSSYINLVASVTTDDQNADAQGQGIYPLVCSFDNQASVCPNVSYIKNGSLSSAAAGQICNVRKVDTLQSSLYQHKKSFEMVEGDEFKNSENTISKSRVRHTIFRELHQDGSTASREVDAHIQLPLKELFDYCDYPEFDCNRHGAARLSLELQVNALAPTVDENTTLYSNSGRDVLANFTAAAGTNNTFTTAYVFRSLAESPYYVGQKIKLAFNNTVGNDGDGSQIRVISAINYINGATADQGKIQITVSNALTTNAGVAANEPKVGDTYTCKVEVFGFAAAGGTVSTTFSSASLVLSVVGSPQGLDSKPRPYQTYSTEEYNGSGAGIDSHQHQVSVEPNCSGVYICYPDSRAGSVGVRSFNAEITSATTLRLRHNDTDLTNRAVPYDSPLSYERLMMTMGNSGYKINSINPNQASTASGQSSQAAYEGGNKVKITMAASPLAPIPEYSQLQINHEGIQGGGTGLQRVAVYKELQKVV